MLLSLVSCDYSIEPRQICWEHTLTSPPKVIWEERITIPHGRECTRLLRVLAVQYPLQTNPITQQPVRYIHTATPDSPTKKIDPSVAGDITPKISNGTME